MYVCAVRPEVLVLHYLGQEVLPGRPVAPCWQQGVRWPLIPPFSRGGWGATEPLGGGRPGGAGAIVVGSSVVIAPLWSPGGSCGEFNAPHGPPA